MDMLIRSSLAAIIISLVAYVILSNMGMETASIMTGDMVRVN
jgi:hypothetical protein